MAVCRYRQLTSSYNGSWGRRQASLEGMPLDIMHLIADHSLAEDLVALSMVSKPLRDLLNDRSIWKKVYARSTLFLPPGPYEWQSTSYLINTLSRARKFRSVWPSLFSRPEVIRTRYLSFGCNATFSVLLGRWLLVAEGSMLLCYDSYRSDIPESAKTLFDGGVGRRILRVFTAGCVRDDGILAFAVLVFEDTFTIAKVLVDRGKPSNIQIVFTSTPIGVEGWTGLINVRLYHRLLVVNIGEYSSDWESSGRLVIMDVDTLRRYHIPASTVDMAYHLLHIVTNFFANKTHFVKVTVSSRNNEVRSKMECFPIPTAPETRENNVLYPSHHGQVAYSLGIRECTVIHESPVDSETEKISFTLCGSIETYFSDCGALQIMEVCLEPNGSISLTMLGLTEGIVASFCIGLSRQHKCGVALTTDKKPFLFALDYQWPSSVSLKWSILDHTFPWSEVLVLDAFRGTAFFSRRSSHHTVAEMVDFTCDAQKGEGRPPGAHCKPSRQG